MWRWDWQKYIFEQHTNKHTSPDHNKNNNLQSEFFGRPGSSEVPRNLLTRWDVSLIPANGIFLTKKKTEKKQTQRVEND